MANSKKNANSSFSPAVIITLVVSIAILAAVIVWSVVAKQANSLENKTAIEIGETKVNGLEYQFFYKNEISNFQNQYNSYLSIFGVDFNKDLNTQTYLDGSTTWAEYFNNAAQNALIENTLLYNEAMAKGYELSSDEKTSINNEIDSLGKAVSQLGYGVDFYLEAVFGKGITSDVYKEIISKNTISNKYLNDLLATYEYTSEDCENYYNENKKNIDTATVRSYIFTYTVPEDAAEGDESYKDEARNSANAMLEAVTDEASFEAYLNSNVLTDEQKETLTEDFSLSEGISFSALNEDIANWVFDSARVEGDKVVIEANNAFNVIYFKSCGLDRYNTVDIRHIFVAAEHDHEEGEDEEAVVAESLKAANAKANDIFNEWKSGAATAESFGDLSVTYSDDSSAPVNGTLTNVYKNYFTIDAVNDWIFDSSRASGDCTVIDSEYGSHIIYFEKTAEPYWELNVKNTLASEAYSEYINGLKESATIIVNEEVVDLIVK